MGFASSRLFVCLIYIAALGVPAFAEGSHDRTQFGHEIIIAPDEKATDVTCFSCSVRVRGRVSGDLTTFGGTVVIEQDGEVSGDTTVFAGDLRLESGARVREVTVFGGKLRRDPCGISPRRRNHVRWRCSALAVPRFRTALRGAGSLYCPNHMAHPQVQSTAACSRNGGSVNCTHQRRVPNVFLTPKLI